MEHFIHLPEYRVVCKSCEYAVLPSHIDAHLADERRVICQQIWKLEPLIRTDRELSLFQLPVIPIRAIPQLAKPKEDGLKCMLQTAEGAACSYICCTVRRIKEHCSVAHDWVNSQKKGRPAQGQAVGNRPWQNGIHCQRIFKQGPKSGYFEVLPESDVEAEPATWAKAQKIINDGLAKVEEKQRRKIEAADESKEPNPWLRRTGWARHLAGLRYTVS